MNTEIAFLLNVIRKELWLRWKSGLVIFVMTAMVFLAAAWMWPKVYTSSSLVLVDQQSILSPLMQGTAVTTEIKNRAKIAEQVIFTQRSMERVIATDFWAGDKVDELTPKELDRIKHDLRESADITDAGQNLIQISFKDINPEKAYMTASLITEIFISESISAKQEESQGAYKFIDDQVSIYQSKLRLAEDAIKTFRSENVEATQGIKEDVNVRMVEIKREQETVELEISSEQSNILNDRKRLVGEISAETNASFVKENELVLRIEELNKRLAELRLNYKETYPDIIQLKGQVTLLQNELVAETTKREVAAKAGTIIIPTGKIAQDIKRSILVSQSKVIAGEAKLEQLGLLMTKERETLEQINDVEAEVAELNRDYDVNKEMYKDLMEQRENARISMNIDIKNQGLTMKIQDPARLPVSPQGLRFAHIILAGLFLSIVIPIGLIFGFTMIDQKVRSEIYLREELHLPILAAVYKTKTVTEFRHRMMRFVSIGVVMLVTWSVYGYAIVLKLQG